MRKGNACVFNRLLPKNRVLRFLLITFYPPAIIKVVGDLIPALTPYMSLSQVLANLEDIRIWAMMGPLYLGLGLLLATGDFKLNREQPVKGDDEGA